MPFELKIKNIGKLDDAEICLDRFTVLAGPNNSGKSFVSKTVYSVVNALNQDYVNQFFLTLIDEIRGIAWRFDIASNHRSADRDGRHLIDIDEITQQLEADVEHRHFRSTKTIEETLSHFAGQIDKIVDQFEIMEGLGDEYKNELKGIKNRIAQQSAHAVFKQALSDELQRNFVSSFQVPHVSHIQNDHEESLIVDIDKIGKFEYLNGQFKSEKLNSWPASAHGFSTIVFLESPICLKLIKALDHPSFDFSHRLGRSGRPPISGIPGYFLELAKMLKYDRVGEMAFPDLYQKLTNDEIMGGRLTVSENGTICFQDNGRRFSMPITASGIANIGMLALLIERKILDKDSLLFVDEPEAHLHPGWQVVLAESLFELARHGVHVVIATHSLEILKWLEVHVKKNPDDKGFVALNQFPVSGPSLFDNTEHDEFENKLSSIKQELSRPFADLYVDGL